MAFNKVTYRGQVVIDLTDSTVRPETLGKDIVAYDANGERIIGTNTSGEVPEGYIKPEGVLDIVENGEHDVTEFAGVLVNVPIPDGYIVPEGNLAITENGTKDVTEYATVEVSIPLPEGSTEINQNGTYNVTDYAEAVVNVPNVIPDGYIKPSGTLAITENGTHDVAEYANVAINVAASGSDDVILAALEYKTKGDNLFEGCSSLTEIPLFDTSKYTSMMSMFNGCSKLTSVPLFNTSNNTSVFMMFYNCYKLQTVPALDMRNVTATSNVFFSCWDLLDIRMRNIKVSMQVGTSRYGDKIAVDSLIHLIYELRDTGSSKTLTMGATNLEKLANVYVKLIDITDEMRAEDDLIDEKLPFIVCDSTDEGATLITSYVSAKNWALA